MKRSKIALLVFFMFFCLFTGCRKQTPPAAPLRLITGVQITEEIPGNPILHQYTQPQQIDAIIVYLSGLRPYGIADRNPERVSGAAYRIEVFFSDGTSRIYRQRANRYFSKDCRTWRLIDPQKGAYLQELLQQTPSSS